MQCEQEGAQRSDVRADWRKGLPVLTGTRIELREIKSQDARALLRQICTPRVLRFIPAPPMSLPAFERFIRWCHARRRMGRHATFAVVAGDAGPIGLIQIWAIEPDFSTAEWGFVFGESVWGKGFFHQSACLLLDFAFDVLGALRVEARCAQDNARGHAALERLGAVREGNLRLAFRRGNRRLDYVMWSILDCEWRDRRRRAAPCRLVTSCR